MKLHYPKILLFALPITILLTLYHADNKNKIYITPNHTPTTTSRVLSECDTQSSIYDKNADIKSVKENFDRQTSQRFEEYEERMKDKRQKRKEERDKNIQKIIEKDKMEKSLAEKIEKGCLKCGCALGGGVLPVWGLVSGLWCATLSQYLSAKALPAGIKKGIEVGLAQIKVIISRSYSGKVPQNIVEEILSSGKFTKSVNLFDMFQHISNNMYETLLDTGYNSFWLRVDGIAKNISITQFNRMHSANVAAVARAVEEGKAAEIATVHAESTYLYSAIGYSVLAILIIVLVMIIIYLILRYRRKKKMNKKAEYTKLLNQ
ncbi:rifin PIR protein, putative [Plasmodium reichenowi]|uniref:Rifin PIR protein, putative n=1 Tax=Plasmodium reichenowi TaxID=5854 RepID=A0A2P9D1D3_PLARE|nr:rifin PIR protein, putative [Plasmodium reichenowi]